MKFRILGDLEAEADGSPLTLGQPRDQKVLGMLLLNAGRVVMLPRLVDALWDENPPASAGKQVRNAVSRLRRLLAGAGAPGLIRTRGGGYLIAVTGPALDSLAFEATVAQAEAAVSAGRLDEAARLLGVALDLCRGPLLAGIEGTVFRDAAASWEERRCSVAESYYDYQLSLGRHREVLAELVRFARQYPLRQKPAGQLMLAWYRCGRQADALSLFSDTRTLLATELGLDPGPELQRLHQQILGDDPALTAPAPAGELGRAPATPGPGLPASADDTSPGGPAPAAVRYSLPPDMAAFTGREDELARIAAPAAGTTGVVAIGAIGGMPGVGKTALAVRAAHLLAGRFPDRQLFVSLHGHTPGRDPVKAEDALAGLLAAAGVDPRYLPGDLDGRAALWRDKMAGQRALLVLDNAASSGQVAPLLPGGGGCLVLVTSRRHLGDLPGAVTPLPLDALPAEQAADMFIRLAPRAAASPGQVAQVVALAGFLPLAISLLARVFARHPSWTLADLIGEIGAGVLTLTAENASIAAAFDLSYRHLDAESQRLFRLLGLHLGPAADRFAAAALAAASPEHAAGLLDGLHAEGLLTEAGYRRYGMHDLLRRYARDRAADAGEGERAVHRLVDYYQHAAARAEALLARQARPGPAPATPAALEIPDLRDAGQALAWVRAERASLLACLDHVTRAGQHARVVALTAALTELLRRDGPWADAITRHATAIQAARQCGDQAAEAGALRSLGDVRQLTGDLPGAARDLEQALGSYRDLGERLGEAEALRSLADVRMLTGDLPGAARDLEQALGSYRDLGERLGEAGALRGLGTVRRLSGDFPGATRDLELALDISRDLGDRLGEANALSNLGDVRGQAGDFTAAARDLDDALGSYRDLGSRLGEAGALMLLGAVRRLTGEYPAAAGDLEDALGIYRDLGSRLGEANALMLLGAVRRLTGEYSGAAQDLGQALGIFRDLGSRSGEAEALNEAGTLHRVHGDLTQAQGCHQQALALARAIASSWDEAHALAGLGRCASAAGHPTQAEIALRQAYEIFQRIGAAEAPAVLVELSVLTDLPGREPERASSMLEAGSAESACDGQADVERLEKAVMQVGQPFSGIPGAIVNIGRRRVAFYGFLIGIARCDFSAGVAGRSFYITASGAG